ncbi:MAG: tetratricopeptide repeat protein [Polyangiaceae bacterium]|nr:tetratricopeptide repeat protein [Polyangiaceae bacterium]
MTPGALSPEPPPATAMRAFIAIAAVAAILATARRFSQAVHTRLAAIGGALFWFAIAAAALATLLASNGTRPLARAIPFVAPLVWAAMAVSAAAVAERVARPSMHHRALVAGLGCLALGAISVGSSASLLGSETRMYERALELDPDNERVLQHLGKDMLARDPKTAHEAALRCLKRRIDACACHAIRIDAELQLKDLPSATRHARTAASICPANVGVDAAAAQALARSNSHADALAAADRGIDALELTGSPAQELGARLHEARGSALEGLGQPAEALAAFGRAIELGASRETTLRAAALAIQNEDYAAAESYTTSMLAQNAKDADALYNQGLIAHKRGDYNKAREGYLATLRVDPEFAVARYNVALLTWEQGVNQEAISHVRRFLDDYPDDPRGAQLTKMIGAVSATELPQHNR